jgi:hypothetical protein
LKENLECDREDLPQIQRKLQDPQADRNGVLSSTLMRMHRSIGVAEYVLNGSVSEFRARLSEGGRICLNMFRRYDSGEGISNSYVSMITYQNLFDLLASADFDLARDLALAMGGRDLIEKKNDHPFDYAFGYVLKAFVLRDRSETERRLGIFKEVCERKAPGGFSGYCELFEDMLSGNSSRSAKSVEALVRGHEKMSKGKGIFALRNDKYLCVWGIGMVNMARALYALQVPSASPLIPDDLLVN